MALVKPSSFFRIAQDRIGLVERLQLAGGPGLGIGLRVSVRVVLSAPALVGQFDLVAPGVRADAQNFAWIHA